MSLTPLPASTLACGGAPATVKPGIGPASALTGTALTAILGLFGAAEAGVIFDVVLAGVNFDLFQICNGGDPGDITLTVTDYTNALAVAVPSVSIPAIAKFHQWIAHAMFSQWCNCADGTSPPTPTVTAPPPYLPNPGAPTGTTVQPCWDTNSTLTLSPGSPNHDYTLQWLPQTSTVPVQPSTGFPNNQGWLIPTGVTQMTTTATLDVQPKTISCEWAVTFADASGNALATPFLANWNGVLPLTQGATFNLPTGAHSWMINVVNADSIIHSFNAQVSFLCNGVSPLNLNTPCCPPDPSVDIRLRSIQDMLQFLMDQTKPSYTAGTVHTGLTGSGTLPISDLVGVKVDITSGVPTNPQLPGTPPYEFSVGWMSVSEPNGMLDEKRITRQHQVWLSGVTPYATVFGYYLNPGFTINVTELIPA